MKKKKKNAVGFIRFWANFYSTCENNSTGYCVWIPSGPMGAKICQKLGYIPTNFSDTFHYFWLMRFWDRRQKTFKNEVKYASSPKSDGHKTYELSISNFILSKLNFLRSVEKFSENLVCKNYHSRFWFYPKSS